VPIDESNLASAEASLGVKFSSDYRDIIKSSDGFEENLPNAHLVLWSLEEVVDINVRDAYGLGESLPGLLLIGSDGGGELLAFDLRTEPALVVLVNAVSSSWEDARYQADSLRSLLVALRAGGSYAFT
jgi:hypothetical protein